MKLIEAIVKLALLPVKIIITLILVAFISTDV